jgi:hypothetical protein
VIRILARYFRHGQPVSETDDDVLGEVLRGASHCELAPEVLMQIL